MLQIQFPRSVKLIIALIYSNHEVYSKTKSLLEKHFGELDFQSQAIPFEFTDYYAEEMGRNLSRCFISFKRLHKPDSFTKIKLFCIELEKKFAKNNQRQINIDPGYINDAKLVLTTTKDYSHRIYLGKGIFAEVTLKFVNGAFTDLPTTFPDYRTKKYKDIFLEIRRIYRRQIC